ncbi:MAG TPA: hypothetical protein VFT56_10360 [Sphingomonas sp.]|nr:hypothetical protein [Sphingomonas sp.]
MDHTLPSIDELEAELASLDERRRVTVALLEAARAYEATIGRTIRKQGNITGREKRGRAAPAMAATENVAAGLMEARGTPVATSEVVEEMRRRGIELPGKNTNNVISARLSNSPKFVGRRGQGYWLADRPWPGDDFDSLSAEQPSPVGEGE